MAQLLVDTQNTVNAAAAGSAEGTLVGRNATTPVGFFGATPVARQVVTSGATTAQIVAALTALGLFSPT